MIRSALRKIRWRTELARLDASYRNASRPPFPTFVSGHERGPVWRLPVPGRGDAFMCLPVWAGGDYLVVHVHAVAFHRAWLATGLRFMDSCPLRGEEMDTYKFRQADQGFSEGAANPVPLAEVAPWPIDGQLVIRFNDGVTRTHWLLAHGALSFPVLCGGFHEARMLAKAVGLAAPIPVSSWLRSRPDLS